MPWAQLFPELQTSICSSIVICAWLPYFFYPHRSFVQKTKKMALSTIATVVGKLGSFVEEDVKLFLFVKEEMEYLQSNLSSIQPFLEDAERRQLGDGAVKVWLCKLKHASYDIEDAVDEWKTKILQMKTEQEAAARKLENASCLCKVWHSVTNCPCFTYRRIKLNYKISRQIKEIKKRLDVISKERQNYTFQSISFVENEQLDQPKTTSYKDVEVKVCGRDKEKGWLVGKLLAADSSQPSTPTVVSIIGPGGIGKTTLAREAYHDPEVEKLFGKNRVWVWVSKHFDLERIAKDIIQAFTLQNPNLTNLDVLLKEVENCLNTQDNQKLDVLLVLDNVWVENEEDKRNWAQLKNALRNASPRSKILMTTRTATVAESMGSENSNRIELRNLQGDSSWILFESLAFAKKKETEREILVETGRRIVEKCKGLPLAIKCLGSLLRDNPHNMWDTVLRSDMWYINRVENEVYRPLLISYCYLKSPVKRCLLYCAIFPRGHGIEKGKLVRMWMAQGYLEARGNIDMETIGSRHFDTLVAHNFLQNFGDGVYMMHDIVHGFIKHLVMEEYFTKSEDNSAAISQEKARHSTLLVAPGRGLPTEIYECERLRSLLVIWERLYELSSSSNNVVLDRICDQLCRLRTLSFSGFEGGNWVEQTLKRIGKLIHLRCLELSHNSCMTELPHSIGDIINLQTLDVTESRDLQRLPHCIGNLIHLRHLVNEGTSKLRYIPKGITRLTELQTLSSFVVGSDESEEEASLEDLKYLTKLRGKLEIRQLSNISKAKEEQLKEKAKQINAAEAKDKSVAETKTERFEVKKNIDVAGTSVQKLMKKAKGITAEAEGIIAKAEGIDVGESTNKLTDIALVKDAKEDDKEKDNVAAAAKDKNVAETVTEITEDKKNIDADGTDELELREKRKGIDVGESMTKLTEIAQVKDAKENDKEKENVAAAAKDENVAETKREKSENKNNGAAGTNELKLREKRKRIDVGQPNKRTHIAQVKETKQKEKQKDIAAAGANENIGLAGAIDKLDNFKKTAKGMVIAVAKQAELKKKVQIVSLSLSFMVPAFELWSSGDRSWDETILEALEAPTRLEELEISYYRGLTMFPSWLMNLTNTLNKITLSNCINMEQLPPLGKLKSLESLEISEMHKVTKVGLEFLGTGGDQSITAFPSLQKLLLYNLTEWTKWDEIPKATNIMPNLRSLRIINCRKLEAVPEQVRTLPTLQSFEVKNYPRGCCCVIL